MESAEFDSCLTNKITRLKQLVNKQKLTIQTQDALLQLSERASTVPELTLLYPAIQEILEQSMPCKNFYVVLQDEECNVLELSYFMDEKDGISIPLQAQQGAQFEQGLTGYVFRTGKTALLDQFAISELAEQGLIKHLGSRCNHWLGVPIYQGKVILGVMVTQIYDETKYFNESHVTLFETIAFYVSHAIERVKKRLLLAHEVDYRTRLLSQEITHHKDTLTRQTILFKISELTTSANNHSDFYHALHEIVSEVLYAKNLFVALYNKHKNELYCPYAADELIEDYVSRPFQQGLTEYVINQGETQLFSRQRLLSLLDSGDIVWPYATADRPLPLSWVGAPLFYEDGTLGIIACQSYDDEYIYQQKDVELINFISQQIANVIARHLAMDKLEQRVNAKTQALQRANAHLQLQIEERKKIEQRLFHDAHHDPLTGLANRSLLISQLAITLKRYQRQSNEAFAVLFVDLDNFKEINDSLGHHAGDEFLKQVAEQFSACIREHDLLARFGGDEFVVLLTHLQSPKEALEVASRMKTIMAEPFCFKGVCLQSGASIGIAFSHNEYQTTDEVIRDADCAMYQAKKSGKGRIELFNAKLATHTAFDFDQILAESKLHNQFQDICQNNQVSSHKLVTSVVEHHTLGKLDLMQLCHVVENAKALINLQIDALNHAALQCNRLHIELSAELLKPHHFKPLFEQLAELNTQEKTFYWLVQESEYKQLTQAQRSNFIKLAEFGELGLSDVAANELNLSLLAQSPVKQLVLSSVFCKRLLQESHYQAQLTGLIAFCKAINLRLYAQGLSQTEWQQLSNVQGVTGFIAPSIVEIEMTSLSISTS